MRILLNASNIGKGGATQVTNSICLGLSQIPDIEFVVVLPQSMEGLKEDISSYNNVEVVIHTINRGIWTKLSGRERYLDQLVHQKNVDGVLSVFGPTWWIPRCPHLVGFALAHLVMPESPFFKIIPLISRIKSFFQIRMMIFFFRRCSSYYYTENELISLRLKDVLHCKKVYTITNYYNQVFDQPEKQVYKKIDYFDGVSLLTISSSNPHKNLSISIDIAKILRKKHPSFNFRFVFTIDEERFPMLTEDLRDHFVFLGPVSVAECPSLYEQCDIEFQPTLLECFTATYPEAMRMKKPIITTDLEFARGLCGDSAIYYNPLSAEDAADKIYELYNDSKRQEKLIKAGIEQLKKFDDYNSRCRKTIESCLDVINDVNHITIQ